MTDKKWRIPIDYLIMQIKETRKAILQWNKTDLLSWCDIQCSILQGYMIKGTENQYSRVNQVSCTTYHRLPPLSSLFLSGGWFPRTACWSGLLLFTILQSTKTQYSDIQRLGIIITILCNLLFTIAMSPDWPSVNLAFRRITVRI